MWVPLCNVDTQFIMIQNPSGVTLDPLARADGSASYFSNGYTIICGINGPIEVTRRDELPEEAAIDVNIRPSSGVGGPYACLCR